MIRDSYQKIFEYLFPIFGVLFVWFTVRGFQYFPSWNSLVAGATSQFDGYSRGNLLMVSQSQWFLNNITNLSATMTRWSSPAGMLRWSEDPFDGLMFLANILTAFLPTIGVASLVVLNVLGYALTALVPFLNVIGYITALDAENISVMIGSAANAWGSSSSVWMGYPSSSSWSFTTSYL